METVLINKKEYTLPTSWDEISLQQYIDLMSIPSGLTHSASEARQLYILGSIPINVLKDMNTPQIKQLLNVVSFKSVAYEPVPMNDFKFNGEEYKAEPVADSVFGAYFDYDNYMAEHGPIKGLPYFLAITARKKGEKYGDYNTVERAEYFRDLPFDTAYNVAGFFLHNSQSTTILSTLILRQKVQLQKLTNYVDSLLTSMAGKGSYLKRLQIWMLRKYLKYLRQRQPQF